MSTVVVITPLLIANWPVISAGVASAVASMSFSKAIAAPPEARRKIEL